MAERECLIHKMRLNYEGLFSVKDLYKLIDNGHQLIDQLKTNGYNASGRLFSFGLAAAGNSSAGVQIRGLDLQGEPTVTRLHNHLQAGSWLTANDAGGVILGRKLAKTLGVAIGDEVVILGQAADGSMANDLFIVRGVLKSVGSGIDRAGFIITAMAFRELMALPDGFHEIAISRTEPVEPLSQFTRHLADGMPDHEVMNWRQLQPVLARIVDLSQSSLIIMLLVTYTAVGILTLNSMLMSVFERIHEFGIMKALGFSPVKVFSLIGLETLLQVSYAALIAIIGYEISDLMGELSPQSHKSELIGDKDAIEAQKRGALQQAMWSTTFAVGGSIPSQILYKMRSQRK